MSNPLSNFFTWAEKELHPLAPVVQNLESDFAQLYAKAYGLIPWNAVMTAISGYVTKITTGELTTLEAHNNLLALAATFVPGGNATLASGLASTATAVAAGLLQSLPVPAGPSAPPLTTQVTPTVTSSSSSPSIITTTTVSAPPTPATPLVALPSSAAEPATLLQKILTPIAPTA